MSKILIDTNIYSAFKVGNTDVIAILEEADEIHIPTVVLGELFAGFYLGSKTKNNIVELNDFLDNPWIEVVDVTIDIAEKYGFLVRVLKEGGNPIPTNDIWIAATALETGSKMMTFDKHFKSVPGIIMAI